eukprot:2366840-Alexandrium_andersonii.AAC.1
MNKRFENRRPSAIGVPSKNGLRKGNELTPLPAFGPSLPTPIGLVPRASGKPAFRMNCERLSSVRHLFRQRAE